MIRSRVTRLDRPGIQGKIGFDPTNVNVPLYKEIEKFMQGNLGLGGSGGTLANRLQTANGFQASHVFENTTARDQVESRLNTQLTEFLQQLVGDAAKQSNATIPGFLQSQGIHGIQQIGAGDNMRLSAYGKDDFKRVSQNPLTGSTEKLARAYMKNIGAVSQVSGGTNEKRTLSAYLRPGEDKFVRSKVKQTERGLNEGTQSKGDLEAFYGTTKQRLEVKNKQNIYKNGISMGQMEDNQSTAVAEYKSKILKQHKEKKLYTQAKQELIEAGEIPDDGKKGGKKEKQSPAAAAAKGALAVVSGIATALSMVKTMVGTMVSLLNKIAMDMGKLIMDSAEVGIDASTAENMRKWGLGAPAYTGGNENILMDAVKAINSKYGDLNRLDSNASFKASAFNQHPELINIAVGTAISNDPLEAFKQITGILATEYTRTKGKKAKEKVLAKHNRILKEDFGGESSQAYTALVKDAESKGWLNEKTAPRLFEESIDPDRVNRMSTTDVHLDNIFGGSSGALGVEHNTRSLNSVLGDLNKIQNSLYMLLLSNMDIIIQILFTIAKGVLTLIPGSAATEGLKRLKATEEKMAKKGYETLLVNSEKYKEDAMSKITDYLATDKGLHGDKLNTEKERLFGAIYRGEAAPKEYAGFFKDQRGAEAVAGIATYKFSQRKADQIAYDIQKGKFDTGGDEHDILQAAGPDIYNAWALYNMGERHLGKNFVDSVTSQKISNIKQKAIKEDVAGKNMKKPEIGFLDVLKVAVLGTPYVFSDQFEKDFEPQRDAPALNGSEYEGGQAWDSMYSRAVDVWKKKPEDIQNDYSDLPYNGGMTGYMNKVMSAAGGISDPNRMPFEIINRVELLLNDKLIASNVNTLSDDQKARSYNKNMKVKLRSTE